MGPVYEHQPEFLQRELDYLDISSVPGFEFGPEGLIKIILYMEDLECHLNFSVRDQQDKVSLQVLYLMSRAYWPGGYIHLFAQTWSQMRGHVLGYFCGYSLPDLAMKAWGLWLPSKASSPSEYLRIKAWLASLQGCDLAMQCFLDDMDSFLEKRFMDEMDGFVGSRFATQTMERVLESGGSDDMILHRWNLVVLPKFEIARRRRH